MELMKTLQNIRTQKENLDKDIENGENMRIKLEEKLNSFTEELQKINESLEQKNTVLNVYDKILNESDSAYSKIVKSTEALYNMVKNEEKKVNYGIDKKYTTNK